MTYQTWLSGGCGLANGYHFVPVQFVDFDPPQTTETKDNIPQNVISGRNGPVNGTETRQG